MKSSKFMFLAAVVLGLVCSTAQAHHSTKGLYANEEITLKGKIIAWRFINPHPYFTIEAPGEDGQMHEWDVSYGGAAVVHLKRQGYTATTFTPGKVVIVTGKPAKAKGAYGILIEGGKQPTWEDGTPVVKGGAMF